MISPLIFWQLNSLNDDEQKEIKREGGGVEGSAGEGLGVDQAAK
jgi:hypothetical protein